jgi:hypothetical protein
LTKESIERAYTVPVSKTQRRDEVAAPASERMVMQPRKLALAFGCAVTRSQYRAYVVAVSD